MAEFYRQNRDRVISHLRRRLSYKTSDKDIDDLAQDVFAIAIRRWDQVQASPNPVGWLIKTADNILLEHFKELQKQLNRFGQVADVDEEEPAALSADLFTGQPDDHPTPVAQEDSVAVILRPLVGRPRQAEQVEMRFAHGLTVDEVAAYLEARPRTVRNNTDRGLALLKEHYGQEPA